MRGLEHQPLHFAPANQLRLPMVVIEQAFTEPELASMDANFRRLRLEEAKVGPQPAAGVYHDQRNSRIAWIAHNATPESRALYLKLMTLVNKANVYLGLDIWGFAECLQYSEYPEGGRFCWHMDNGVAPTEDPRPPRKISFTLQLSRPGEYEGGDLEFLTSERLVTSRNRGAMIVFPSYWPHRVDTVTRGLRRSLAGWVCGPDFR